MQTGELGGMPWNIRRHSISDGIKTKKFGRKKK